MRSGSLGSGNSHERAGEIGRRRLRDKGRCRQILLEARPSHRFVPGGAGCSNPSRNDLVDSIVLDIGCCRITSVDSLLKALRRAIS